MTVSLPENSREYVEARVSGPSGVVLTTLDVEMAVVARAEAILPGDWEAAEWVPGSSNKARLLIGPGSPFGVLAPGAYSLWVRLTSGAEEPVRNAGTLIIVPVD